MPAPVIDSALASVRAGVDALLGSDFDGADEVSLGALIDGLEVERRRLDALDSQVLAAADQRHLASSYCRSSTADLLVHRLRVSPGEAAAGVRRARDVGPRRTLTGEPLEPIHPILASAQRAGEISTRHIDVAGRLLEHIPADISVVARPVAERFLVDAARHETPAALARTGTMLLEALDPDGAKPNDHRAYARRNLHLHHRPDGTWRLAGDLTDEVGLVLRTVLDPLAAPKPAENGERDDCTAAERTHDALGELCAQVLRAGILPDAGGVPVTVVVRVDADSVLQPDGSVDPAGIAQTERGDLIRLRSLARLAGDAEIVPIVVDRAGSDCKLYLGRTRRLANRAQRRALIARDGGCSFPGCDRPSSWCEVHHVIAWAPSDGHPGGRTDIDNLTLVCGFHHREFDRRGWRVQIIDGRPRWTPPRWIDPDQRPRTNTAHHLPQIVFGPDGELLTRSRS